MIDYFPSILLLEKKKKRNCLYLQQIFMLDINKGFFSYLSGETVGQQLPRKVVVPVSLGVFKWLTQI